MKKIFLLSIYISLALNFFAQKEYSIIPKPKNVLYKKGNMSMLSVSKILNTSQLFHNEEKLFINSLDNLFHIKINQFSSSAFSTKKEQIVLIEDKTLKESEYKIKVNRNGIHLIASTNKGMFYAMQSLIQMINLSEFILPFVEIDDEPNFNWRGMHLDVCRHFFTKEEVKKYIDYLVMYKMNTFHWHLTEDQGWRIEIKKYPKLTEVGAWRNGSMVGKYSDNNIDTIRYGGYYTQEDIKEVVAYAQERHITIVPEIEMPGHALAALASYPEYSCTGGPFEVAKKWGVFDNVYCAGNDSTFTFIQNILDEVLELFPSEFIHIGGDECPKTRWEHCEKCQKRINDENLKDEHELQSYFIQRVEKFLNSKGRKIIGWDEILEGGLVPNAAVMSWRGTEGGIAAANQSHYVVMSPGKPCYFDHYQNSKKEDEPHAIGGLNTLQDVYSYHPIPFELEKEKQVYIMGAQANVWTEYMTTFSHVEYMALPRMAAIAEVLWTKQELKNYDDFIIRLKDNVKILDKKGVNYCKLFLKN